MLSEVGGKWNASLSSWIELMPNISSANFSAYFVNLKVIGVSSSSAVTTLSFLPCECLLMAVLGGSGDSSSSRFGTL